MRGTRWLPNDMRRIFGEMVTKNEWNVSRAIIVMQKPRVFVAHNSGVFGRIASRKRLITLK